MVSLSWEAGHSDFIVLDRSDASKVKAGEAAGACLLCLLVEEERCTSQSDSMSQSFVLDGIANVLWYRSFSLLNGRGGCKRIITLNASFPGQSTPTCMSGPSSTQIPEDSALVHIDSHPQKNVYVANWRTRRMAVCTRGLGWLV